MKSRVIVIGALAIVVLAFVALHAIGARQHVGVLSGTLPSSDGDLILGLAYALAWFALVLIVPIVTLTLTLEVAWRRIADKLRSRTRRDDPSTT